MAAPHNPRTDIAEKHSSNAEVALNASHHNVLLQHLTTTCFCNISPQYKQVAIIVLISVEVLFFFFVHGRFATSMCNTLGRSVSRCSTCIPTTNTPQNLNIATPQCKLQALEAPICDASQTAISVACVSALHGAECNRAQCAADWNLQGVCLCSNAEIKRLSSTSAICLARPFCVSEADVAVGAAFVLSQ
jgi:hypothetical protein